MLPDEKILTKKQLRKNALEKRKLFADSGILKKNSSLIVSKILNSDFFKNAKHVGLYFPIKNEVDILSLHKIKDKFFYLPSCVGDKLEFRHFNGIENLKLGSFGILESVLPPINPEILDVVFIPALMANKNCYRLGYGKGYYDRFFSQNKLKAKKIIVVQSAFVSDIFVQDFFDVKCDSILSEI